MAELWEFPANPVLWFDWHVNSVPGLVPMAESGILSDSNIECATMSCTELATYMLFCGYYEEGCKLLEAVVKLNLHEAKPISDRDKLMLEVIWKDKPELRFADVPWPPFTAQEIEQKRANRRGSASKPEPYRTAPDLGRYKYTEIPALVETCRVYLCQPDNGTWPHKDSEEVFEAMQKLHKLRPERMPITHSWGLEIELALHLGAEQTRDVIKQALEITSWYDVRIADSRDSSWMGDCLCFEGFIAVSSSLPMDMLKMSQDQANAASRTLVQAIDERLTNGQQMPLQSVGWKELLDRLAIAVHARYPDMWEEPEDILSPPATQAEIEATELRLGITLPQDFKEMVAIHNGFDGGEDFLCGGNCGIEDIKLEDAEEVEHWLFDLPPDRIDIDDQGRTMRIYEFGTGRGPKTDAKIISIMQKSDCERSRALIVPHAIWKRYGDPTAKDGDYRYVHSGVDESSEWPSIRRYVGEQVVRFEADAATRVASNIPVNDPELALETKTFWKRIKGAVKDRSGDHTTAEEAIEVFREAWKQRPTDRNGGRDMLEARPPSKRGPGLALEESVLDSGLRFGGYSIDAEKAMQTDELWNHMKYIIGLNLELSQPILTEEVRAEREQLALNLVELFRNAWEERSRGKKRRRDDEIRESDETKKEERLASRPRQA